MQKIVKQPLFFAAAGSFLLAVIIAIATTVLQPNVSVADKFCRALEKSDTKKMASCLSPELTENYTQDALLTELALMVLSSGSTNTLECITGEAYDADEDGVTIVPVIAKVMNDDYISYAYTMYIEIVEIDGKEYVSDFY